MYIRKKYLDKITPFIDKPVIKVITGMRRVGKSYFVRQIIQRLKETGASDPNILYIDMESLDFEEITTYKQLNQMVASAFSKVAKTKYLFVDEIQEILQWEKAITSIANQGDIDIYITGSNAHLFSSELATLLSGRYIEFPIYSLSFHEFRFFSGLSDEDKSEGFQSYLKFGGLPAIHHFQLEEEIVFQYVSSIYNTILLKDIVKRHQVRNVQLLENISRYVFDNIGNIFSAKKISDYMKSQHLKVSVDTVQNYLRYFLDALIIYKVPRYDLKGKRYLDVHEKYYLADTGMRHAAIGFREADISGLLENLVFLELKRRGYGVCIGKLREKEIDFIATKEKEKIYIQVAYLLASSDILEREFGVLIEVQDNYPKYVVSLDTNFGEDYQGIRRLNLIDFLSDDHLP